MKKTKDKIFYYADERTDDFATTVKNVRPLPQNYRYANDNVFLKFFDFLAYRVLIKPFAWVYMKLRFHYKTVRSAAVKKLKTGCLIYANHTLLLGDAFLPSLVRVGKKSYILTGEQANSLTKLLPILRAIGAIPLTDSPAQNRKMLRCMRRRLNEKASITVYPEAHVWPYYTDVRNFPISSFKYAAYLNAPVVCMTTCYQKRKFSKTPKTVTFLDGPFFPDPALPASENATILHAAVYDTMKKRTEEYSTYSVYQYVKKEK